MTIIIRNKKKALTHVMIGLLAVLFGTSCIDKFEKIPKYERPEWLEGKVYTQISSQPNMSIFSQFMKDVGYDEVLDKTGTYAAFVPSDSVMEIYLTNKYGTSDPAAIDSTIKSGIVKYHILQMPWSKNQLQSLSGRGWISLTDISNNKPTAFKRKTLLREPNQVYRIQRFLSGDDPYDIILPDDGSSAITRKVYSNSPKYAPLFFDDFLNANEINPSDYSFYFDRSYEPGEMYYANAKLVGDELFAENGFVYTVDQVVEPLKNAEQLLKSGPYSQFLQLINNFSVFEFNQPATLAQEGADQGAVVEDLYNLSFSSLPFDINSELIGSNAETLEENNGLLAPTNDAMDQFFSAYFSGFGSTWNAVPRSIQKMFIKTHMIEGAIYESDFNSIVYNGQNDVIDKNEIDVEETAYGSNCTFIGLKKAIVPKALSSVSATLVLNPEFYSFYNAYDAVNLLSVMKDPYTQFSLFLIDDIALSLDSTLYVSEGVGSRTQLLGWDHGEEKLVNLMSSGYRDVFKRKLFGHIGVQPLLGVANREFIETLDGRHIIVQNDTVSGGVPSEFGINSGRDTTVVFSNVTTSNITNGSVYKCDGWLKFPTTKAYNHLDGSKFLSLLDKVGMANILNEKLSFVDPTERYTIFVPSDAALDSINADSLSLSKVKELVGFHIVKGEFLFTDGRQPMGSYLTYNNQYLNLDPRPDNLVILDKNNEVYYDQLTLSDSANLMGMYLQNNDEDYYITNVVVHRIDKVIMPY